MNGDLVVLGATGATGRRVTALALAAGLRPVLAGRNAAALHDLAAGQRLEVRVGGLGPGELDAICAGARVVISSVGPYTRFGAPVVEAALRAGAHYIDFSGEPRWIEALIDRYDAPAAARGCVLVGSVGLGAAADLALAVTTRQLPTVDAVTIGYRIIGMQPSPGSFASTIEMFAGGAPVVDEGTVRYVSVGSRTCALPGGRGGLFPTPDPLLVAHGYPGASAACYMQAPVPALALPAMAATGELLRRPRALALGRAAARLYLRIPSGDHGGGGRSTAIVLASGGGAQAGALASVHDVYEFSARCALHAAQRLLNGAAEPGVRSFAAVAGEPARAASEVGARLSVGLRPYRQDMVGMLVRGGFTRESAIEALRTLTSYILGYTMLTCVHRRSKQPGRDRRSFDHGLSTLMAAIRLEQGGS
jgi:Saccharopine dehydrogenase NADP binding domain